MRIKILTEQGLEYASHKIGYHHASKQQIKYIEAQSFTLQEDGSVKTVALEEGDIQTENINEGYSQKVFSIPGAQVGSIIEYRYKKWTQVQRTIDSFWFQGSEPSLWSEIRFHPPKYTSYVTIPTGVLINRMVEEKSKITLGTPNTQGDTYRYYMENIPAFRPEPYTKNLSDYYAKVEFQLHSYASGTGFTNSLFHTWDELIENLLEDEDLGGNLLPKRNSRLLKELRPIYEDLPDAEQKMIAIYDYVRTQIEWNKLYRLYCFETLNEVHKQKTGSGVQKNLLLTLMLQDAGIEANLMLTSTRNNGFIVKSYPLLYRFNHVICRAKIGEKHYVLDAKDKYRPYNIVPANLINCSALVLKESKESEVEWIEIESSASMSKAINAHVKWSEGNEEEVTVMVMEKNEGYAAIIEQANLEVTGEENFAKTLVEDWTEEGEPNNYKFQSKTEPKNLLVAQYEVESDKFTSSDGTRIYFNTFATTGYTENPFKLEERLFPIDFNFPSKEVSRFMIDLPKGYKVEDLPESAALAMEGNGAKFKIIYKEQPNQIQVISTLEINKSSFNSLEYQALKTFFDKVVEKHMELIVLTKEE